MIEKDITNYNLINAREQWLDKLRYKNIKLAKCEEKRRRKQDNITFQRDWEAFFGTLEEEEAHEEERSEWKSLLSFGEVFEKEKKERHTGHGWKR